MIGIEIDIAFVKWTEVCRQRLGCANDGDATLWIKALVAFKRHTL